MDVQSSSSVKRGKCSRSTTMEGGVLVDIDDVSPEFFPVDNSVQARLLRLFTSSTGGPSLLEEGLLLLLLLLGADTVVVASSSASLPAREVTEEGSLGVVCLKMGKCRTAPCAEASG
jgi:hypothetical protein